jgi:hypothetical protein
MVIEKKKIEVIEKYINLVDQKQRHYQVRVFKFSLLLLQNDLKKKKL